MTDFRTSLIAAVAVVGCTLVVALRVAFASPAPHRRQATPAERAEIAGIVGSEEGTWSKETTQNFPADRWSQRDDFHGRESRRVQELAKQKGIRIEDALRAIDDDIHRRNATSDSAPEARNARAVPCKPRPFYD